MKSVDDWYYERHVAEKPELKDERDFIRAIQADSIKTSCPVLPDGTVNDN
jgi:hypothetical protein